MAALDDVGTPGLAHQEAEKCGEWKLLDALKGGTRKMRTLTFLPRNPRESDKAYFFRSERSFLHPGFKGAIDALTSLPFQKPLTIEPGGPLDKRLVALEKDCDRQGTRLHDFAQLLDEEAMTYRCVHVLTDYPSMQVGVTRADDAALDRRPYFCAISPRNLIRWSSATNGAGKSELSSIAILEEKIESKTPGSREEVKVQYVREITRTTWTIYKKGETGAWAEQASGKNTLGRIPLRTAVYDKDGPPLLDLAWTNLRHFQSESDGDTALSFARIPLLFGSGLSEAEVESINEVGPGMGVFARAADADLKHVEHAGAAIEAGRLHAKDLMEQMVAMGAQPLIQSTSATATGEAREDKRANCKRQEWANSLAHMLEGAYADAAEWIGVKLPEKFAVKLNGDYVLVGAASMLIQGLQIARDRRDIGYTSYHVGMKRFGVFPENSTPESEQEELGREGDPLSGPSDEPPPGEDRKPPVDGAKALPEAGGVKAA